MLIPHLDERFCGETRAVPWGLEPGKPPRPRALPTGISAAPRRFFDIP